MSSIILEEQISNFQQCSKWKVIKVHPDFNVILRAFHRIRRSTQPKTLCSTEWSYLHGLFRLWHEVKIVQAQSHISLQEAKRVVRAVRKIEKHARLVNPHKSRDNGSRGLKAMESYTKDDVSNCTLTFLQQNRQPNENSTNALNKDWSGSLQCDQHRRNQGDNRRGPARWFSTLIGGNKNARKVQVSSNPSLKWK